MFDSVKEKEGKKSLKGSKSIDVLPPFVQHPPSHTAFASVSLHMGDRFVFTPLASLGAQKR
jgi:hypothetical protein